MSASVKNERAKKARRDFYFFAEDLHIIDTVFDTARAGVKNEGRRMTLTKTQWVRTVIHDAVLEDLLPLYIRIMAAAGKPKNGQSSEES